MNADQAVKMMRGPNQMHIICIDVTNKCDLACSNCTRLLENQDGFWEMTPDQFRTALRSLKGYPGVIAMIGGNPCMHRQFPDLCSVFVEEIPHQIQRGLWTNNYFKHKTLVEQTFGTFNLNSHGMERAENNLADLHRKMVVENGWMGWNYGGHSQHAPLLTAVKDLYEPDEMWQRITECDINREWSATIIPNKGELKVYFCEVAASFDLARGTDYGMPLEPGWWQKSIEHFESQVKHFCPGCGVPAKHTPSLDKDEVDTYTDSNADIATKNIKRKVIYLKPENYKSDTKKVTLYNETLR